MLRMMFCIGLNRNKKRSCYYDQHYSCDSRDDFKQQVLGFVSVMINRGSLNISILISNVLIFIQQLNCKNLKELQLKTITAQNDNSRFYS